MNNVNKITAWRIWLSLGATAVLGAALGCGEVGGAGQCNGVDVTGLCIAIEAIQPTDITGTNSSDVDVIFNPDCDGDPTTIDPEDFGKHSAGVTISADLMSGVKSPPAPAFVTFTSYTVQYIASATNLVSAPALTTQSFAFGGETNKVNANESLTRTLELVPIQTKDEFVSGGGGGGAPAVYTARYTITGTSQFNQDVVLIGTTIIDLGNFNLCQ